MTLGQAFKIRFNELLSKDKDKRTLYKFLKDNCIARSTIKNILDGNTKSPTLTIIYQVSYAFNITPLEFLNHPVFLSDDIDFI